MPLAGAHRELAPQSASVTQLAATQRPRLEPLQAQTAPVRQSLSFTQPNWHVGATRPPSPKSQKPYGPKLEQSLLEVQRLGAPAAPALGGSASPAPPVPPSPGGIELHSMASTRCERPLEQLVSLVVGLKTGFGQSTKGLAPPTAPVPAKEGVPPSEFPPA